jgi:hypothetical protein
MSGSMAVIFNLYYYYLCLGWNEAMHRDDLVLELS